MIAITVPMNRYIRLRMILGERTELRIRKSGIDRDVLGVANT